MIRHSTIVKAGALGLLFVFALVAGRSGVHRLNVPVRLRTPWYTSANDYREVRPGPELALVFVESPTCVWCNAPELPELIERAKRLVREQAIGRGFGFATVGISSSRSASTGIEHLTRFGDFDEVSSGRSWHNEGILKYVYRDLVGPAATPQVLVVQRVVLPSAEPGFTGERVLLRHVGLGLIEQWVDGGAVVPKDDVAELRDGANPAARSGVLSAAVR